MALAIPMVLSTNAIASAIASVTFFIRFDLLGSFWFVDCSSPLPLHVVRGMTGRSSSRAKSAEASPPSKDWLAGPQIYNKPREKASVLLIFHPCED
jgi:hypothetical protein